MKLMRSVAVLAVLSLAFMGGCNSGGSSTPAAFYPGSNGGSDTVPANGSFSGGSGSMVLAWSAPTKNVDGSALTNLSGYNVHYGTTSGNYSETAQVGQVTNVTLTGLQPGTYFIAVSAVTAAGSESSYSNEVSKTIQ